MKRFIAVFLIFLTGCATVSSINKHYERISYSDGINRDEAKLIGKKQLITSSDKDDYEALNSEFWNEINEKEKYSDYYFLLFYPKDIVALFNSNRYLTVINKKTGSVIFAGVWDVREKKIAGIFDGTFSRSGYYSNVRAKIRRNAYKNYKGSDQGIVFLNFMLLKDGTLKDIEIDKAKTKASDYLINLAIQSVNDSAPFPPFYDQAKDHSHRVFRIVIDFSLQ